MSEEIKAALAGLTQTTTKIIGSVGSLESNAERLLSTLQEIIEDKMQLDWATMPADVPLQINQEISEKLVEINEKVDSIKELSDQCGETLSAFEGKMSELLESVGQLVEENLALYSELEEQVAEIIITMKNEVVETFNNQIEHLTETVSSLESSSNEFSEETLSEGMLFRIDTMSDVSSEYETQIKNIVARVSADLLNQTDATADYLIDYTKSSANERVDALVEGFGQDVLEYAMREAMESIIMMQVSAVTTQFLQPYLPQIMVANKVAPAIQDALDLLRMGP